MSDSPKPRVDRTSDAIKLMKRTRKMVNTTYLLTVKNSNATVIPKANLQINTGSVMVRNQA